MENILPVNIYGNKTHIDWKKSIGKTVEFIYDDIKGNLKIVDYKKEYLYVKYLDYDIFKINSNSFKNCKIGTLIRKRTNEFKVKIGQIFKDDKRDFTIIDKKNEKDKNNRYWKIYKYHCNKCNNEDWIKENHLLDGENCNTCCIPPKKIVLGINTIWDKARWMVDLGVSEEDAKRYTASSNKKIIVKCPHCEEKRLLLINNIYNNKSISCPCSDKVSYPEKFMISVLEQLNINFKTEYVPKWCRYTDYKDSNKIKTGRYDFLLEGVYIDEKQVIIETDGGWHGKDNKMSGIKKEESEYIDNMKDKLALENGYKVIRIDCKKSESAYIKQNILNSKLNKIFNLNNINWLECEEFALSNRVKEICDYWNLYSKEYISTIKIGKVFNISANTILSYLKRGAKLGWCDYDAKKSKTKSCAKLNKTINKVEIFKDGKSLGVFINCAELSRQSEELFGVHLIAKGISSVTRGERKSYKGYTFTNVNNKQIKRRE